MRVLIVAILIVGVLWASTGSAATTEEVQYTAADGVRLYADVHRTERAATAPLVLLFHQARGDARGEYGPIVPVLTDAGFHVIAADIRGGGDRFGNANRSVAALDGKEFSYCAALADLEATLDFARAAGFSGPVFAWGSSYTAALVVRLAHDRGEQLAGYLAFSPASGDPMAGCQPGEVLLETRVPGFVVRPQRELEIAPRIGEQLRNFERFGAVSMVVQGGVHGSSTLVASRTGKEMTDEWEQVLGFLRARTAQHDTRVVIENDGWELVGDLRAPVSVAAVPVVLMLNQAGGHRQSYRALSAELARRGIASLRLDLRGHGESTNLARFDPQDENRMQVLAGTDRDVVAARRFLAADGRFDRSRLAIVGASYSCEEMIAASRQMGHAAAYVELSPGSFSEESLAGVDPSGVPWLFVRAEQELAFFDELFAEIEARAKSAEFRRVQGRGHGATLMDERPELVVELADWLQVHLAPR